MQPYLIDNDIMVMYMTAPQFPNDVPSTYTRLEEIILDKTDRRYFGFSQPNEHGTIMYRACAAILKEDEPIHYGLPTMIIRAGEYVSIYIENHFEDEKNIPSAFDKLLRHPKLDPIGFCLEIYKTYTDPDVLCLVPILHDH